MHKDEFVEILLRHLQNGKSETADELIHDVVAEYIYHLMGKGNIPHQHLNTLEQDLKEEAQEIYKKKTYGYMSLKEYRNSQAKSGK